MEPAQNPEPQLSKGWLIRAVVDSDLIYLTPGEVRLKSWQLYSTVVAIVSSMLDIRTQFKRADAAEFGPEFSDYVTHLNSIHTTFNPSWAIDSPLFGITYGAPHTVLDAGLMVFALLNVKYQVDLNSGRVSNLDLFQKNYFGQTLSILMMCGVAYWVLRELFSHNEQKDITRLESDDAKLEKGLEHVESAIKTGETLKAKAEDVLRNIDTDKHAGFMKRIRNRRTKNTAYQTIFSVDHNAPILRRFADDLKKGMGKSDQMSAPKKRLIA